MIYYQIDKQYLNGGTQLEVKVTLQNPLDKKDKIAYYIEVNDTQIGRDWHTSLKEIIKTNLHLEKNYCFLGFPKTQRTLEYLCEELNTHVKTINMFNYTDTWQKHGLKPYIIFDHYTPDQVRWPKEYGVATKQNPNDGVGLGIKDHTMNVLHNHFERLQNTVENPSPYYQLADYETKYAIRQLNNLCHEIESLILSQRKDHIEPEWTRPSQITTYFGVKRKQLTDEHRQGFSTNGYDRQFGGVYMHWTQIGKTLIEVFRDEGAPDLDETTCEAITHLQYYSGEFDVEWARDVLRNKDCPWHDEEQLEFENWLLKNGLDPKDPKLSLGYLPLGQINFERSFGTTDMFKIWNIMSNYLDIYSIEIDDIKAVYEYCWSDEDHKQQQINKLKPGYDYQNEMAKKLNKQD